MAETARPEIDEEAVARAEAEGTEPLLRAVGKIIKTLRENAKLTQVEFGEAIGYGVEQVSSVERGRRAPKAQFIEAAERVLNARGVLKGIQEDIDKASFSSRLRQFVKVEGEAVEIHEYNPLVVPGLLQTEAYTRTLYRMRRPLLAEETIEQNVAERMSRRVVFDRWPAPIMSFVIEESVLRRPVGGKSTIKGQYERILQVGVMRNVEIQVVPWDLEDHAQTYGMAALLELKDRKIAYSEAQGRSFWFTKRAEVREVEARYGIIRAQALTPRESCEFIEKLLGET
ncbi:helix-turn-helix domain-containing protein [Streptomyces sp. NBC_01803]|uniref:helix-turn-helix domain-containing protein n=1 Tax=Streptomyces sp. NBC_01803 TaxID=2975946 RepID=UPI002DDC1954|nr:helix-turn-helix transcriptional regulator [Streptomyces sp. NBC_01803]WSA46734.1 helix-turn-helix transcriptional regulator [Streptomyces sp. NBC_01803]